MKRLVIVGGGVAGLSAGIFGQLNGFETVVLEKNAVAGGQCMGWDRRGYHIDGCIHWLVGTRAGTPMNELWKTVGALDGVDIFHPESFFAFDRGDTTVHLYRDLERLRESWLELSPEDADAIEDLVETIRRLQGFEINVHKPMDLMNLWEKIRWMLSMRDAGEVMNRYAKVSLKEYVQRFAHPAIREPLSRLVPEEYSAAFLFFALANFTSGQASLPAGGSLAFSQRMVERYESLGGQLQTGAEVKELVIQNGRCVGARMEDGRLIQGDYYLAACDARWFFDRLLSGQYSEPAFEERFARPEVYPLASQVMVALGFVGSMAGLPRTQSFPVTPFPLLQEPIDRLAISHFAHEPGFAPEGHTLLTCSINQYEQDVDAWQALGEDASGYRVEKQRIGDAVLQAAENHFPEMRGRLEVLDVVTPLTYERYCHAYRGAFMGFMMTTAGKMMDHPGSIRGLPNVYLTGQWLQPPGGLPVAVVTGKHTVMRICRREKIAFQSE